MRWIKGTQKWTMLRSNNVKGKCQWVDYHMTKVFKPQG